MSLSKQQEFRETRRLKALQLLKSGKNQTQVATELGVSHAAVSQWVKAARLGGKAALEAKPISGRPPKLSDAQLQRLTRMLSEGPSKHGFPTELWTLQCVAELVRRKFGVTYDQSGIWHVLRRLNWTQQKPERQARERDEKAVQAWRSREWPRIKKTLRNRRTIVFVDESGFMLQPTIRKTWAPRGQTPILKCYDRRDRLTVVSALSVSPQRRRLGLLFDILDHNLTAEDFDLFVTRLLRKIRGPPRPVILPTSFPTMCFILDERSPRDSARQGTTNLFCVRSSRPRNYPWNP